MTEVFKIKVKTPRWKWLWLGLAVLNGVQALYRWSTGESIWRQVLGVVTTVCFLGTYLYFRWLAREPEGLSISDEGVRFRTFGSGRWDEVKWSDVAGIEWLGHDKTGLRLTSGKVASVACGGLDDQDRQRVKAVIRAKLEKSSVTVTGVRGTERGA